MATKKYGWFIDIAASGAEKLAIVENTAKTSGNITDKWRAIQSTGTSIRVESIAMPTKLTAVSSTLTGIEARYLKGILNRAIAEGYKDPRNVDINTAQYFDTEYEKTIRKAKKHAKSSYQTTGKIIPQDF